MSVEHPCSFSSCFIIPPLIPTCLPAAENNVQGQDLAALIAKANDAMRFSDQLHELGIDGPKQLEQCKKLFALGVHTTFLIVI